MSNKLRPKFHLWERVYLKGDSYCEKNPNPYRSFQIVGLVWEKGNNKWMYYLDNSTFFPIYEDDLSAVSSAEWIEEKSTSDCDITLKLGSCVEMKDPETGVIKKGFLYKTSITKESPSSYRYEIKLEFSACPQSLPVNSCSFNLGKEKPFPEPKFKVGQTVWYKDISCKKWCPTVITQVLKNTYYTFFTSQSAYHYKSKDSYRIGSLCENELKVPKFNLCDKVVWIWGDQNYVMDICGINADGESFYYSFKQGGMQLLESVLRLAENKPKKTLTKKYLSTVFEEILNNIDDAPTS